MALVNPSIAMSFKPTTEYQPRNVLADFANLQKIQSEQMEMAKLKREENTQNALANAYSQSVDPTTGAIDYNKLTGLLATGGGGKEIPTVQKARRELETAELTKQKTGFEVQKAQNEFIAQAQRDTSQNPSDANITAYKEDLIANPLFDDDQKQKLIAGADRLLAMTVDQRRLVMSSRGASASELKPTTQVVNRGGQTDVVQIPAFGGAPVSVGMYADVPLPPDVAAQKEQIAQAGRAPGATVILPPQEKAEKGERGKMLVNQYSGISDAAKIASKTIPSLENNLSILDKGFKTGFGTESIAAGAKVLAALGVEGAEKLATNSQTFLANANAAVLQRQLEQKGPQTESDAQRITATGAQLGNTPAANKFLINVAKEQAKRDIEQRNFYDRWWKQNNTYDGAEDAWYSSEGGKSLFDRPALRQYSVGTNAAAQIPTVSAPVAAPAARAIPPAAVQMLLSGQGTDAQFDAMFGAGAAKRARGGR